MLFLGLVTKVFHHIVLCNAGTDSWDSLGQHYYLNTN
jgi:hypothetical protein